MQMLYQWDVAREPIAGVMESFWRVRSTVEETRRMAERLARGASERIEEIDAAIAQVLIHWRLERVAAVDKNILRIAAYELLAERGTPAAVVLNEAVEMARRFGEADSPPFVNGVLDALRRQVRGGGSAVEGRAEREDGGE
jgi:N utilization substance protein B